MRLGQPLGQILLHRRSFGNRAASFSSRASASERLPASASARASIRSSRWRSASGSRPARSPSAAIALSSNPASLACAGPQVLLGLGKRVEHQQQIVGRAGADFFERFCGRFDLPSAASAATSRIRAVDCHSGGGARRMLERRFQQFLGLGRTAGNVHEPDSRRRQGRLPLEPRPSSRMLAGRSGNDGFQPGRHVAGFVLVCLAGRAARRQEPLVGAGSRLDRGGKLRAVRGHAAVDFGRFGPFAIVLEQLARPQGGLRRCGRLGPLSKCSASSWRYSANRFSSLWASWAAS